MDHGGVLADFLVCKIGVAFVAFALLGAVLSMHSSFGRVAEEEELKQVVDTLADAIVVIDGLPGESEVRRELPIIAQQFEVTVEGERSGEVQLIKISVTAGGQATRVLMLATKVNDGEFTLLRKNPSSIHLRKISEIQLELM